MAAGESDLEFAAEVLALGMAEQVVSRHLRVGRYVESLIAADAGDGAGGDIADGVAAGLARRDADRGQPPHRCGRVFDVDVVELKVLPRGDVGDAVGVLFRQLRQHLELRRVQAAERDLDALHARGVPEGVGTFGGRAAGVGEALGGAAVVPLAIVVALAVDAAAEAGLREDTFFDFALTAEGDFVLEDIDFGAKFSGNRSPRYSFQR